METPRPGQRWMSTSEPELGLGLVLDCAPGSVRLLFPAGGELRHYALESAPLQRVAFQPGDTVSDQDGTPLTVRRVEEENGLRVYIDGSRRLPEAALCDRQMTQGPRERFLLAQTGEIPSFLRRFRAWQRQHHLALHPARGLMGGRIDWIPHQIAIARELSRRLLPRVLLADEVGLGKTIEAGLVLHHAVVTGRAQRILVLVPEALIHQWFVELLRRFHLSFAIYDEARCPQDAATNPFLDEQLVLCGTRLLADAPTRLRLALDAGWDLLVVDEAHHLTWHPETPCPAYQAVEALADRIPSVLLLTATPDQGGTESHFAHLRLLDPDRYPSLDAFLAEQSAYRQIADQAAVLRERGETAQLRTLLDQHGPGRVMFRNTRGHIQGFPARIVHPQLLDPTPDAKLLWLAAFLQAHPDDKVLLMTRTPAQVRALDTALRGRFDARTVLFHEEQALIERDRQAAWFAEPGGAQVMIASDIGGEGRNFQFVHHLILFDLPRDPERVEQRIGRLDRIGQRFDIHIHVPVLRGEPEEGLLRWLHEGLDVFARPLQCAHRCLERFADRLEEVDDALIAETLRTVARFEEEQRAGRNRLIQWKHELEDIPEDDLILLRSTDDDPELLPFADDLWEAFGLQREDLGGGDQLLKPGSTYTGELPLRPEGRRFTLSRSRALAREDMDLLTWDHPFIRDAIEALLSSPHGTCSCVHAEDIESPVLQAVYIVEAIAPASLGVKRFLPPTPLLFSVDARGKVVIREEQITREADLPELLHHDLFRNKWFPDRLADVERRAARKLPGLMATAEEKATAVLDEELERLCALRQINDHVREDEIQALRVQRDAVLEAIRAASVRLDALRVLLP